MSSTSTRRRADGKRSVRLTAENRVFKKATDTKPADGESTGTLGEWLRFLWPEALESGSS